MKRVIEISDKRYKEIVESNKPVMIYRSDVARVLVTGTPLNEALDKIGAEIEPKCDRINSLASVLPYTAHREIQELLCEIMDICKAERELQNENCNTCIHHKPDNPYCECCFDLNKFEPQKREASE